MSPGTERQKRFRNEHTVTTKCREHIRDLMRPAGKGPLRAACVQLQCHSPKSSHPLPFPLPQSPKDCSIHVSLLLSRIQGYRYHLSKFHIYVLVYCIGVFLSGLLHSVIGSSFIHLIRTDSNVFFLMAE